MKRAAVGFRVHSGWTARIALTITKGSPAVLVRQRTSLVKTFTYKFRQPYHTAEKLPPQEARAFVARVRSEARRLALRAIRDLKAEIEAQGYALTSFGLLLASGRPLPALAKILASHSIIHTADGELFREALLHAAAAHRAQARNNSRARADRFCFSRPSPQTGGPHTAHCRSRPSTRPSLVTG